MTLHSLLLIKHSLPEILETVPAHQWHLSEEGRQRCHDLAIRVQPYFIDRIISSLEPKAIETGEILAKIIQRPHSRKAGLHEHDRSNEPFLSRNEFETKVLCFFENPSMLVMGTETADQAHSRFQKAIDEILISNPNKDLAVVTHGTVISLFVSRIAGINGFSFWKKLGLPSFVALSLPEKRLSHVTEDVQVSKLEKWSDHG